MGEETLINRRDIVLVSRGANIQDAEIKEAFKAFGSEVSIIHTDATPDFTLRIVDTRL